MFLGVPYLPFFIGTGTSILFSMWFHWLFIIFLPISIFVMRGMAKRDEMVFRMLGLRLQFRLKARNIPHHDGMWSFSPNAQRERLEDVVGMQAKS